MSVSRALVNALLFFILAGLLGAAALMKSDVTRRNYEVMFEMVNSVAYDSQSANPNFPDGKTLQLPPEGTVARGYLPLGYGPSPEEAKRAGRELVNPFAPIGAEYTDDDEGLAAKAADDAVNSANLARGAHTFQNFCQVCHGPDGMGDGAITQRGFPPPVSLHAEQALKLKDGQMFHILAFGQKNMPPYASQLSRDDRWKAILYVRDLQLRIVEEARVKAEAAAKAQAEALTDPTLQQAGETSVLDELAPEPAAEISELNAEAAL